MMASALASFCGGLVALVFFTVLGVAVGRRLFPDGAFAFAAAPALGWGAFNALALPILAISGFGPAQAGALAFSALALAGFDLWRPATRRPAATAQGARAPALAYGLAVGLACLGAAALLPKEAADGVSFAAPIFDHSKIAIVAEIVRSGAPPENPFFAQAGEPGTLGYYYLWHFSAAMLSLLPGVSAWEADVGLTGFTAAAAMWLVVGLAVRLAGRAAAAYWAIAVLATAGAGATLETLFGRDALSGWISGYPGLATPLVQMVWAPQHVASASLAVLAALIVARLSRLADFLGTATLGLVNAVAFGASVWVGGVTLSAIALAVAACGLTRPGGARPMAFAAACAGAAAIAALSASPILAGMARIAASREEGLPVALHPYEVLGAIVPDAVRRALDLPAFWLARLPLDAPAVYLLGMLGLAIAVRRASAGSRGAALVTPLAATVLASLVTAWLFVSTVLNNDLGWRATLPAFLALAAFGAAGMSRLTTPRIRLAAAPALLVLAAGLQGGAAFVLADATGRPFAGGAEFLRSREAWSDVRRQSSADERIASNPLLFADATPWPVNLSWALLADRRSCYAGWELARPFAPLGRSAVERADRLFVDLFAGRAADAYGLLRAHDCRLVVLNRGDGAWANDPFAADARFRALAAPDGWRIYRVLDGAETR